jgi:hypothetical protein
MKRDSGHPDEATRDGLLNILLALHNASAALEAIDGLASEHSWRYGTTTAISAAEARIHIERAADFAHGALRSDPLRRQQAG